MIKRIVDISEPSYLHLAHKQLIIEQKGDMVGQIPVEDLGVLILQNPAIVTTQALLLACQQNNVAVVVCDEHHLPYSVLLPLTDANSLHSKIIRQQVAAGLPTRKRLWQQIIRQKIATQATVLKRLNKNSLALERLVAQVKSGDGENMEAQAAQKYWRLLFGDQFRRDTEAPGINSLLNYGYAIMRALVARAIVASGLHPALGLNHRNQYDGLCLADDLMEPLRPWVDYRVYRLAEQTADLTVGKHTKVPLLNLLSEPVICGKQTMPLMVACHYLLADIKRAYGDKAGKFDYPRWPELEN
jgi:CRISPR-associated protein Cas1